MYTHGTYYGWHMYASTDAHEYTESQQRIDCDDVCLLKIIVTQCVSIIINYIIIIRSRIGENEVFIYIYITDGTHNSCDALQLCTV